MGSDIAMRIALRKPQLVRGLVLISPWSHTSGHTRSVVDRPFGLAEVGDISIHTELLLRYVLLPTYLKRHNPEVERLRALIIMD
jgi:pimeloyl-ACP methyl ester carboxylesterase